jgi:peptidoglycan/xylan/chitin deacetylase (PgdA/CDA1 family)
MNELTIITYHYVREIRDSKYPEIKGLELEGFKRQLDYLMAEFTPVSAEDAILCCAGQFRLPSKACLLTFDDGFIDHSRYVLPALVERGIKGAFFAPVRTVIERKVLDVHKVHFILACHSDHEKLAQTLESMCMERGIAKTTVEELRKTYGNAWRYDNKEVILIKRILQRDLPEEHRQSISEELFRKHVSIDETDFANELYMSTTELKQLVDMGMYVGSHGTKHLWLEQESYQSQEEEIKNSLEMLKSIDVSVEEWIMCYPYGSFNDDTLDILVKNGCKMGLTTEIGTANPGSGHDLTLPRLDTNEFPQ